eukprot:scaffold31717_cov90-Phaeocystis_antarctica.AAC.2
MRHAGTAHTAHSALCRMLYCIRCRRTCHFRWGAMHATPAAPRAAPIRRATLAARNQYGYRPLCLEQLNKLL